MRAMEMCGATSAPMAAHGREKRPHESKPHKQNGTELKTRFAATRISCAPPTLSCALAQSLTKSTLVRHCCSEESPRLPSDSPFGSRGRAFRARLSGAEGSPSNREHKICFVVSSRAEGRQVLLCLQRLSPDLDARVLPEFACAIYVEGNSNDEANQQEPPSGVRHFDNRLPHGSERVDHVHRRNVLRFSQHAPLSSGVV